MNKLPLIAICILIAACTTFAQTALDAAELTRLLNEFINANVVVSRIFIYDITIIFLSKIFLFYIPVE